MVQFGMFSLPWLNNPSYTLTNLWELESEKDQHEQSRSNDALNQNEWELKGFYLPEVIPLLKSNQVE